LVKPGSVPVVLAVKPAGMIAVVGSQLELPDAGPLSLVLI